MPTLGIACLQGYLSQRGYTNINVWDSNVDYVSYLLDSNTLQDQAERIRKGQASAGKDAHRKRIEFEIPFLIESIADAINTFRDPDRYYLPPSFNRAVSIVQRAMDVYSTEPEPLEHFFDQNGFFIELDSEKLPFSLDPLVQFVEKEDSFRLLREFLKRQTDHFDKKKPYDVVAFSCPNPQQFLPSLIMAQFFKAHGYAKQTIIGGSFVTVTREVITNDPRSYNFFDYIMTFEGEAGLAELLQSMESGQGFEKIPNLHYMNNNRIVHNPSKKVENLSELPTPDFNGFPMDQYWTPEPVLPTFATRGCFYDICTFCNHHENYFGNFRVRDTEKVIGDLRTYKTEYNATKIFFVDELMIPWQQVEIAEKIHEHDLETRWYAHSRVAKQLTKERLDKLAKGGLTLLHVGMESANTNVLNLMKKGYDRKEVLRFLKDVGDTTITLHLNTIRDFPGEQPQDYIETLQTAVDYAKAGDYVHLYQFGFEKGAPIHKDGNPFVKKVHSSKEDLNNHLQFDTINMEAFTDEEERQVRQLSYRLKQEIAELNDLYPKECCWAAHLLYVSHYREKGEDDLIDIPRKEMTISSERFRALSPEEDLGAWSLPPCKDMTFTSIPTKTGAQWYAFDPRPFTFAPISEPLMKALKGKSKESRTIAKLSEETNLTLDELKDELYLLIRQRMITLLPPNTGDHRLAKAS